MLTVEKLIEELKKYQPHRKVFIGDFAEEDADGNFVAHDAEDVEEVTGTDGQKGVVIFHNFTPSSEKAITKQINIPYQPSPVGKSFTTDIYNCARCGQDHKQMEFKPLVSPVRHHITEQVESTHWAMCPNSLQPVLCLASSTLGIVEKSDPEEILP